MSGVKRKVGPLNALAVPWYSWFWSTAEFGDSMKRAPVPPLPPLKVG